MDQIRIGRFIAQCRKAMGLTQRQLADGLGISDKTNVKMGMWQRVVGSFARCCRSARRLALRSTTCFRASGSHRQIIKKKAEENMMELIREMRK